MFLGASMFLIYPQNKLAFSLFVLASFSNINTALLIYFAFPSTILIHLCISNILVDILTTKQ